VTADNKDKNANDIVASLTSPDAVLAPLRSSAGEHCYVHIDADATSAFL
jgi:hypothetical protein